MFEDASTARTEFASVNKGSDQASRAASELSRLESERGVDFLAARAAAHDAYAAAKTAEDRAEALTRAGAATIAEARTAWLSGKCFEDDAVLRQAVADLRGAIEEGGPRVEPTRLLLLASLFAGDGPSALQAWQWYYGENPPLVKAAGESLAKLLPRWSGAEPGETARIEIADALAGSKFFDEADLMLRNACWKDLALTDPAGRDIVAYASSLRALERISDAHYRAVAQGRKDEDFEKRVGAEAFVLWKALSWEGAAPEFSLEAVARELARRFGTVASLGKTDNIATLLLGHRVVDETREVEQYGRKASLHFVQIDGVLSAGYMSWLTHNDAGTGGWSGKDAIYQIRPMYVDGPVQLWLQISDPILRARRDEEIATETRRDAARVHTNPIQSLRGLTMRLKRQYALAIRDSLAASGLTGDELRSAFIARTLRDTFESSIWAHEGRHAIDKMIFHISDSAELEFRAKLSEVALAPSPRLLGSILWPVGGSTPHGIANKRILEGVTRWMAEHASEIPGFQTGQPALPQLDLLSDGQLRAAFRSLDPLATQSPETHSDAMGLRYTVLSAHVESAPANDRHCRQPEGGRG
ncbi:MAG: hypothetical protein ABI718_03095 [Acidobacteriota bacterium]